jgi:hypothetical protein
MPLIPFKELITESGDLKLLHTSANISAPEIHKMDDGSHVAVHRPSTAEHADWLKGKFDKAMKHNPSQKHIKVSVHHDGDNHEVRVTHTPPKNIKEELLAERFNKRDAAEQGVVHPDHAKHMKVGETHDFYHPKNGDKVQGKIVHNDGKSVHIEHGGKHHKFKVASTYPGLNEETLLEGTKAFNKGDHVHLKYDGHAHLGNDPLAHGVVHSSSDRTAHVKWEDGTESKHLHTTGKKVGDISYYGKKISHNTVADPEKGIGATKRLTNDEHKEYFKKINDEKDAKRAHADKHRSASEKLSGMHPSELKPHHLEAIHDILNRAKAGHD